MGTFGFFIFLSVLTIAYHWRAVQTLQLRRDLLAQALASGQTLDLDKLAALVQPVSPPVTWAWFKIGLLVALALPSLWLSWAFWEAGTMPLVVAAVFALGVAGATWNHERTRMQSTAQARQ